MRSFQSLGSIQHIVRTVVSTFYITLVTSALSREQAQTEPYVREVVQLEQWLMEGAYNKVLAARQNLPAPQFAHFMDLLATTVRCASQRCQRGPSMPAHPAGRPCVRGWNSLRLCSVRDEVAGCSEEAYTSLKLEHARQLLMFEDNETTSDYAAQVSNLLVGSTPSTYHTAALP